MWEAQLFSGDNDETALRSLVAFINKLSLTKDQFEVIVCPEHPDRRLILLYQKPEEPVYKDYPSLCQADVLSDQWR